MRYEIRSIGLWSTIKIWFPLNLIIGFGLGFVYVIAGVLADPFLMAIGLPGPGQLLPVGESPGAVLLWIGLVSAFMHGVIGTLLLVCITVLYNLGARLLGGWEVALEPVDIANADTVPPVAGPARSKEHPSVLPTPRTPRSPDFPPPPPPVSADSNNAGHAAPFAVQAREVPGWTGAWPREETISIPEETISIPEEPEAPEPLIPPTAPDTPDKENRSL